MCMIDPEPCEVFREEWRTARKEHRCSECGSIILPGREYLSHFSIFEGDVTSGSKKAPPLTATPG